MKKHEFENKGAYTDMADIINDDRPPVPGAKRVEDYDRSTGHVSGYWRMPDGRRVESIEINSDDSIALQVLNKEDHYYNDLPENLRGLSNGDLAKVAEDTNNPDLLEQLSQYGIAEQETIIKDNAKLNTISDNDNSTRRQSIWRKMFPALNDKNGNAKISLSDNAITANSAITALSSNKPVDSSWEVRREVAKNSNTTTDTLSKLANDSNLIVRRFAARNKNTSPNVLRNLANLSDSNTSITSNINIEDIHSEVARNENTPVDALETLAGNSSPNVRKTVAHNKNTPVSILRSLASDDYNRVRAEVAENENTPADVLEALANDNDIDVLASVAGNGNTSSAVLRKMSKDTDAWHDDEDGWVKSCIVENKNTPVDVLEALAKSEERYPYVDEGLTKRKHDLENALNAIKENEKNTI